MNNGDDCFSPKANTSNIYVNHMYCNGRYIIHPPPPPSSTTVKHLTCVVYMLGSHGQSMGSIGQYAGELDYIEHVLIENVWIVNSQFGGRLKTWAGSDVGYGYINNVTFRNFYNADNEYSAYLDSCYFNVSRLSGGWQGRRGARQLGHVVVSELWSTKLPRVST